jgi:hypothetical protein
MIDAIFFTGDPNDLRMRSVCPPPALRRRRVVTRQRRRVTCGHATCGHATCGRVTCGHESSLDDHVTSLAHLCMTSVISLRLDGAHMVSKYDPHMSNLMGSLYITQRSNILFLCERYEHSINFSMTGMRPRQHSVMAMNRTALTPNFSRTGQS